MTPDIESSLTISQVLLFTERYNRQRLSLGAALILCLFLGWLGIHRFYLRKYFSGIMFLVFSWTFIPALLSIMDLLFLKTTITRYNNLLAIEILHSLNSKIDQNLLTLLIKPKAYWTTIITTIFIISAAILISSEIYLAIRQNIFPTEIIKRIQSHQLSSIFIHDKNKPQNQELLNLPYYNLDYDGLSIGTTLNTAQRIGYDQCTTNQYVIICANNKEIYPDFLDYKVQFAIAEFTITNELISLHLYLESTPNFHHIITNLATETITQHKKINYLNVAGSHENISINESESSISIGNRKVQLDYQKYIQQQKLLKNPTPTLTGE